MADLGSALARTLRFEGGWVDDPVDRGGETYCGISRCFANSWIGWQLIDAMKQGYPDKQILNRKLAALPDLEHLVFEFYREHYWRPLSGARIASQTLADQIFDCAVHVGVKSCVKMLQEALNLLAISSGSPLNVDGVLGPLTLAAIEKTVTRERDAQDLSRLLQLLRGAHYLSIVRTNPTQRRYLRGWLRRLTAP
jgi:lysozyme family protein